MENIFLEIKTPNVKGASLSDQGKGKIELLSYSQSVSMPVTIKHSNSARSHGRADFSDFTVTKYIDDSSPVLLQAVAGGTNYKEMIITTFKAEKDTGKPVCYLTIDLEDVIITSLSLGHSGHDEGVETLSFNFNKIKWTYVPQTDKSSGKGKVVGAWDLEANKK